MRQDIQALQVFIDTLVQTERFSYPARQDSKRPEGEFAVISLITEKAVGLPCRTIVKETTEVTEYLYSTLSELRFRVGIVETDGEKSTQILHGWYREDIKDLMVSSGYGFIACKPVVLEDAKLESFWEARQGLSIFLYVTRERNEIINNFTSLVIGGEYIVPDLSTIALNININP